MSDVPKIKFLKSEAKVEKDRAVFRAFSEGKITAEAAAREVALNNNTVVTKAMFLRACVELGWAA